MLLRAAKSAVPGTVPGPGNMAALQHVSLNVDNSVVRVPLKK